MTKLIRELVRCKICGTGTEFSVVGSTNTLGLPDLDLRPSEMMRSTIHCQVQCCPSCGYSASYIGEFPEARHLSLVKPLRRLFEYPKIKSIIRSEHYLRQLYNNSLPKLANQYLCVAIISEASSDFETAFRAAMQAAWVCDDADAPLPAERCRQKAIRYIHMLKGMGKSLYPEKTGLQEQILADLFRRTGRFGEAKTACIEGLSKQPKDNIAINLRFEKRLADASDRACHTFEEAVKQHLAERPPRSYEQIAQHRSLLFRGIQFRPFDSTPEYQEVYREVIDSEVKDLVLDFINEYVVPKLVTIDFDAVKGRVTIHKTRYELECEFVKGNQVEFCQTDIVYSPSKGATRLRYPRGLRIWR